MADTTRPTVVDSYPAAGGTNIPVDAPITVQFSEGMDVNSITNQTFIVVETGTFFPLTGTIQYDEGSFQSTLTPQTYLNSDTQYTVIIMGNLVPGADPETGVKDLAGNAMNGEYSFDFTTGDSVLGEDVITLYPSGVIPSGAVYASGVVTNPEWPDKVGYLAVEETWPENYQSNVPVDLESRSLEVKFTADSSIGHRNTYGFGAFGVGFYEDAEITLRSLVDVTNESVLGYGTRSHYPWEYDIEFDHTSNILRLTTNDSSPFLDIYNDATLASGALEYNNQYLLKVSAGFPGWNADDLQSDYSFIFTTEFQPLFTTTDRIRLLVGPLIRNIPDDTVNRIIHANSIYALSRYSKTTINIYDVPWCVEEYVLCKSALDVLKATLADYGASGADQTKVLGDLRIQYGSTGPLELVQQQMADLAECSSLMLRSMRSGCEGVKPVSAIPHRYDKRWPIKYDRERGTRYPFKRWGTPWATTSTRLEHPDTYTASDDDETITGEAAANLGLLAEDL